MIYEITISWSPAHADMNDDKNSLCYLNMKTWIYSNLNKLCDLLSIIIVWSRYLKAIHDCLSCMFTSTKMVILLISIFSNWTSNYFPSYYNLFSPCINDIENLLKNDGAWNKNLKFSNDLAFSF